MGNLNVLEAGKSSRAIASVLQLGCSTLFAKKSADWPCFGDAAASAGTSNERTLFVIQLLLGKFRSTWVFCTKPRRGKTHVYPCTPTNTRTISTTCERPCHYGFIGWNLGCMYAPFHAPLQITHNTTECPRR